MKGSQSESRFSTGPQPDVRLHTIRSAIARTASLQEKVGPYGWSNDDKLTSIWSRVSHEDYLAVVEARKQYASTLGESTLQLVETGRQAVRYFKKGDELLRWAMPGTPAAYSHATGRARQVFNTITDTIQDFDTLVVAEKYQQAADMHDDLTEIWLGAERTYQQQMEHAFSGRRPGERYSPTTMNATSQLRELLFRRRKSGNAGVTYLQAGSEIYDLDALERELDEGQVNRVLTKRISALLTSFERITTTPTKIFYDVLRENNLELQTGRQFPRTAGNKSHRGKSVPIMRIIDKDDPNKEKPVEVGEYIQTGWKTIVSAWENRKAE